MKYTCVRQQDTTDCGAACLATILKHYNSFMAIAKIRDLAGTDRQGTNVYGMVQAARKMGFEATGVEGDEEALFSDYPLPAIAHVIIDGSLLHYVVIHSVSKKEIVVADPAKGIVHYTPQDFLKIWSGVMILLTPSKTFSVNQKQSTLGRFFSMVFSQKKLLLPIFFFSLAITASGILASFYYSVIMDHVFVTGSYEILFTISISVLGLYIIKSFLEYLRSRFMLNLSKKIDLQLIPEFNKHLLQLPLSFFGTRKSGEIMSRYSDASKIRDALADAVLTIMIDSVMAIGGGIVLFLQNKTLFLVALIMLILYGGVVLLYNKPIRHSNRSVMEDNAQFSSYLYESIEGIETIKAMNNETIAEKKSKKLYDKLWVSVKKKFLLDVSQSAIVGTIAVIGETLILWLGTVSVLNGNMTIGSLITFHALLAYFLSPAKNLLNLQPAMQNAIVAAERLNDVFDLDYEHSDMENKDSLDINLFGNINIKNLSFRYGTRELVLDNANLFVKAGQKIAFVGESGSGKTTLAKLLLRFYSPESGSISINDTDICDIPHYVIRDKIAYIPQETFLFSGTIKENLLLAKREATDEEIQEACRMSQADSFINKMPLGYDSLIEENGSNLSGGQKQRLAIARAILRKPDILIMDEATSNLDIITEKAIEKTLEQMSGKTTMIIIAHRLSTIKNCDSIYVFEDGKIIEEGSHKKLISKKGKYAHLWKQQSNSL